MDSKIYAIPHEIMQGKNQQYFFVIVIVAVAVSAFVVFVAAVVIVFAVIVAAVFILVAIVVASVVKSKAFFFKKPQSFS